MSVQEDIYASVIRDSTVNYLTKPWPNRDYNRAIFVDDYMYTPTMIKFRKWYENRTESVIADMVKAHRMMLSGVEGFYDIDVKKQQIDDEIRDRVLLKDKNIQKIDLALKAIMRDEEGGGPV